MALLESLNLPLGAPAADFLLEGVDGRRYTLNDFADAKVTVIVFMCNHCPYVQEMWGKLVNLQADFKDRSVEFVGINPNTANPEYEEETMEKMKEYALNYEMNFPYLEDPDQAVAKKYKAQCTPDIYLFDEAKKLAYHGRIDELGEAIEAVIAGKAQNTEQKPSRGCSIKWVE